MSSGGPVQGPLILWPSLRSANKSIIILDINGNQIDRSGVSK